MKKQIVYVDMDGVIVDFESGIHALTTKEYEEYQGRFSLCPGIFSRMTPIAGALEAMEKLTKRYDVYLLSSPGWGNSSAWSDKYDWVVKYLPYMKKRLILSSQKHLNKGDYLIDDRLVNGSEKFTGKHIHFGQKDFPDWESVLVYLLKKDLYE